VSALRARSTSVAVRLHNRIAAYSATTLTGALSITCSDAAIVYVNNGNQLLIDAVTADTGFTAQTFDLNSDAVADFRLWTRDTTGTFTPYNNDALFTSPFGTGLTVGVVGQSFNNLKYPSRLNAGNVIDGSAAFLTLGQVSTPTTVGWLADGHANGPGYAGSQWTVAPGNTGFLGVRFKIGADDHYAWVRITVAPQSTTPGSRPRAITIHEWAYEDVAGAGIAAGDGVVPEPTSLGLLALGSLGLARHRRRGATPESCSRQVFQVFQVFQE